MRLLITRPLEQTEFLSKMLENQGFEVVPEPLLKIEHKSIPLKIFDNVQGIIVTSARALENPSLDLVPKNLPLFVVGEITAKNAKDKGFSTIFVGQNSAASLANIIIDYFINQSARLVYLSSNEIRYDFVNHLKPYSIQVERIIAYLAKTSDQLSDSVVKALENKELGGVVFFSPRTAEIFVKLTKANEKSLKNLVAWCASQSIADVLERNSWQSIVVAESPAQESMISALKNYKNLLRG